ncbi:hypothetical protein GGR92_004805 [Spirosoma lacussanchae]|uniref:hypothetical protein n=1 Tax=Spirosoma lacussanchae TaxID=1884249 RepID=UPI00110969C9|nr:hypothetical protein [Spirosoma lacussanchae]
MPTLTPDQAQEITRQVIEGLRHSAYDRTVELRRDYLTILSGHDYERFLTRFIRREEDDEYKQRLQLTHQNLSSTSSPLVKKFGQISRIQDIKKGLNFSGTTERDQRDLQDVLNDFGGENSSSRGSLDDYLSVHYDLVSLYDPNAFLVLDFAPFDASRGERARPYAILFEAPSVLNYRYTRGRLDFLVLSILVAYTGVEGERRYATDYLCLTGQYTYRYFEYGDGRQDLPGIYEVFELNNERKYFVATYVLNIDEVQAVRLGYMPDAQTGNSSNVSPLFHAALEQFKELLDLKSKNDLVTSLHAYPRRYEYAPACPGETDPVTGTSRGCNDGKVPILGTTCKKCHGTGYLSHTSEQDVLRRPMPDDEDKIMDLSKLSFTEKPDLETVQGFDEKIQNLIVQIYQTVFSSDSQVRPSGPRPDQPQTATEYVVSRDDQNNTLLPFADQKSAVYKSIVRLLIKLMNISGTVETLYEFPRDLKLSGLSQLYADLKAARDAGAPDFEIEQILDDIARKRYEADPTALERYFIKKQHVPYFAQTLDAFEFFDSTGRIPQTLAVLRANVDVIFGELEIESPTFYDLPYTERDRLVMAKVDKLMAMLPRPVEMSIGA